MNGNVNHGFYYFPPKITLTVILIRTNLDGVLSSPIYKR
jgi:hypothetical protein